MNAVTEFYFDATGRDLEVRATQLTDRQLRVLVEIDEFIESYRRCRHRAPDHIHVWRAWYDSVKAKHPDADGLLRHGIRLVPH